MDDRHPLLAGVPGILAHSPDPDIRDEPWNQSTAHPQEADNEKFAAHMMPVLEDTPEINDSVALQSDTPNQHADHKRVVIYNISIPRLPLTTVLAILTIVTNVGMNVSLPLYSDAVQKAGSDPYAVLFFAAFWFQWIFLLFQLLTYVCSRVWGDGSSTILPKASWKMIAIIGVCLTFNGIFVVYASLPERTPPYLQAILSTTMIPYTIFFRYLILRKGVGVRRLVTCGCVLVGLFITVEPTIFGLDGSTSSTSGQSAASRLLWPMVFALGFVPVGVMNVLIEKEMKKSEVESYSFLTWTQIVNFVSLLLFFWTDFVPGFGMADSWQDFVDRLHIALRCHYGVDESCYDVVGLSWIFIAFYCSANLCLLLLTRYAEGAIYTAIIVGLVTPMGALWWSFFKSEPHFHWDPEFTTTTAFTLAGLCIMVPSVVVYNIFSMQEEKATNQEDTQL